MKDIVRRWGDRKRGGEGEMYGKSNIETYITICKIDNQQEFAVIFSHSEDCLFILLIVSFAVQKLLSLIRSHLFTFVFISITVGTVGHRGSCFDLCHRVFCLFFL